MFGSDIDFRPPSLGAASRRDPGGKHENEDPEPSGQGRSPRPCSRWRCFATDGGGMNLRAVVPAQGGHDGRLGAAGTATTWGKHEGGNAEPSSRGDAAAQSLRRCRVTSRGQPALSTRPQESGGPAPASRGRRAKRKSIAYRRVGAGTYDRPGCRQRQAQRRRFAMASR